MKPGNLQTKIISLLSALCLTAGIFPIISALDMPADDPDNIAESFNESVSVVEEFSEPDIFELDSKWQDAVIAEDQVLVKMASNPRLRSMTDLGVKITEMRLLNPAKEIDDTASFAPMSADDTHNNVYLLTLAQPGEAAVAEALYILNNNPAVEIAEPNIYYQTGAVPNDPLYNSQYALGKINAAAAWNVTTGSKSVTVGIIDSGIQGTHPDLADNLWVNPNPNRNGFFNDVHGYDFVNNRGGMPSDPTGHGTHVAGIIGAKGNNSTGVTGVNWDVSLVWMGIHAGGNNLSVGGAIEALNYANNHNIQITNNSYGGSGYSEIFRQAIANYNGLFVAAAGNDGKNNDITPVYPAGYNCPNIITVASTTNTAADSLAGSSNFGAASVHIAAPGDSVLNTYIGSQYAYMSGTSMAAPHVAGVAALIKAKNPGYTALDIRAVLINSGRSVPGLNGKVSSGRIVDAAAALGINAGVTRHEPPSASINYAAEALSGLVPGAVYHVNNITKTADSGGLVTIESSWFDTSVRLIRAGSGTISDSDARYFFIPARAFAPSGFGTVSAVNRGSNGFITGTDSSMEYKQAAASAWIPVSGAAVTDLAPGTYHVRIRATDSAFASAAATVTVSNLSMKNGWNLVNGSWYYCRNGAMVRNEWLRWNNLWYWLGSDGIMVTGRHQINGVWYHFNSSGAMLSATWLKYNNSWYYFKSNGSMAANEWFRWNDLWYWFNSNGVMVTGWQQVRGIWYYFNPSGAMLSSVWLRHNNSWYYFKSNGAMANSEWLLWNNSWYYFNQDGTMLTGFLDWKGKTYYLRSNGSMVTGWFRINNVWYYFNRSGAMVKNNWLSWNDNWYYLKADGSMASNESLEIKGRTYRFRANGSWIP